MTLIKTLNGTAGAYGYGDYSDYMPHGKRPGKWLPPVTPVLCQSGYHYCRSIEEVARHLGDRMYEVEVRGVILEGDDKAAAEQMRLTRRLYADTWTLEAMRLFAVDCARLSLKYAADKQRPLLSACLDGATAAALYPNEDWAGAQAAWAAEAAREAQAAQAAWAAEAARAGAQAAWASEAARAARAGAQAAWAAAALAARIDMGTLLERYLASEQGPFVDADGEIS